MKVLFVANRFPYPPFRGDKLKIFNLVRRLSNKHSLALIAFYEDKNDLQYLEKIEPFFDEIHLVYQSKIRSYWNVLLALFSSIPLQIAYFKNSKMHRLVQQVVNQWKPDVVHTQHLRMSQYTKDLNIEKVLDLPDAFSLYFQRRNKTERAFYLKILDLIEKKRLPAYERNILEYDKTLVCSIEDKKYLEKLHSAQNIGVLLNGVDLETFYTDGEVDYSHHNTVLFTGNMDYAPNVDAVIYFTKEIWPTIAAQFPQTKFVIAGQRPLQIVKNLANDRIEITGFVPDLRLMYANASVVVAPLRFGAGTQNKVLEAMAMGVPVVCTNIGFEGLQVESGQGVVLALDKKSFLNHLIKLLESENERKSVGQKGQAIAQSRFSWDVIVKDLENHFKEVIS